MNNSLDVWLVEQANQWVASSSFLSDQAVLFNQLELSGVILTACVVSLWFSAPSGSPQAAKIRRRIMMIFIAFFPTYLIARLFQKIIHRPRPLLSDSNLHPIGDLELWNRIKEGFSHWGSFPSDHAALFFIFVIIIFSLNRKIGFGLLVFTVHFSFLRIALGYHWTSDIIGGALLGSLVALCLIWLEPRVYKLFDRGITAFESRPGWTYAIAFIFLVDLAGGFELLKGIFAVAFHTRLFH